MTKDLKKINEPITTIKWHEMTLDNQATMLPLFQKLKSVYIKAFTPLIKKHIYATDPRIHNLPDDKKTVVEQKIITAISKSRKSDWKKRIDSIYEYVKNQSQTAAYVALAEDENANAIGFALFKKVNFKNYIKPNLINLKDSEFNKIKASNNNDEIYVNLLAVAPDTQKRGAGKKLLFSVFKHCPEIKKIYLTTSASPQNKNTRAFYEHIGFKKVLTSIFPLDKSEMDWGRTKIIYLYEKQDSDQTI